MKQRNNKWVLPLVTVLTIVILVTVLVLVYLDPIKSLLSSFREKADMDTYEKISMDLNDGKIDEVQASEEIFLASFYGDDDSNNYKAVFHEDTKADIRSHIQNLVSNYDQLSDETKLKLKKIIFPELTGPSLSNPGRKPNRVFAAEDEELYPMLEYELLQGCYLLTYDMNFFDEYAGMINIILEDAFTSFSMLAFETPDFRIEIVPSEIDGFLTSYSVMLPDGFAGLIESIKYRIFVNFNEPQEDIEARLIHELFHAFQEQALNSQVTAVTTGRELDWLKEATAVWAVDQVYPDNDTELDFAEGIYKSSKIEYYSLGNMDHYTWYQMFFYFSEVLDSVEDNYVHNLFTEYRLAQNMDAAFAAAHGGRMFLNRDFAELGMALFGHIEENKKFVSAEPSYPSLFAEVADDETFELEDITDEAGDPWRAEEFSTPGFTYKLIMLPEGFEGKITILQDLPMQSDMQYTGMRIAVNRNNVWKWEYFALEPATHIIDVGSSMDVIDSILIMHYSTGFEDPETEKYKLTTGKPLSASGTITVTWKKDFELTGDTTFEQEKFTLIISEELSRSEADIEDPFYATLSGMVTGDRYSIDKLDANYIYEYKKIYGNKEDQIIGAGVYNYPSTGSSVSSGSASGGFDIPGLSGLESQLEGFLSTIEDALEGLSGLPGMESYSEYIPELPELPDMSFDFELPDLPDIPGIDLSGGKNDLARIVIRPELGVFELLPSIPVEILNEDWVEYEYRYKYPDPDDPSSTKTDISHDSGRLQNHFPLWFVNPEYSEEMTQDEIESQLSGLEGTGELFGLLGSIQKKMNKMNIQKLIDDPQIGYQIDVSDSIDPTPLSATMTEKAMFNTNDLKAEISADIETHKGNAINLEIVVSYNFD